MFKYVQSLHTVCFMHGLSDYEIKRICHRAHFFIISYESFHPLTNETDERITLVINIELKLL